MLAVSAWGAAADKAERRALNSRCGESHKSEINQNARLAL